MSPVPKVTTVIRMGAAHYDLTVTDGAGRSTPLDLSTAKRKDKAEMAEQLCAAYGITGPKPKPFRHYRSKTHHGKHQQGHRAAGQLPGQDAVRQDAPGDGPKKRSRRRRAPRPVSASGPTPN